MAMTADDKKWEAENDARTVAEAAVITADPARLAAAKKVGKPMAKDKEEEVKALKGLVDGVYDHKDSKEHRKAKDDSGK